MKIVGIVIFIVVLLGLSALITFEIVSIVKRVKQYRKSKTEKKGE